MATTFRTVTWLALAALVTTLGCAAGTVDEGGDEDDAEDTGGSGPTGGEGGGGTFAATTGSGSGSSNAATTGSGAGAPGGPMGTYAPNDVPPFKTALELCTYVNGERTSYASHDRYRGPP